MLSVKLNYIKKQESYIDIECNDYCLSDYIAPLKDLAETLNSYNVHLILDLIYDLNSFEYRYYRNDDNFPPFVFLSKFFIFLR